MVDSIGEPITRELEVNGVLILAVEPGSPAANAGLRGTQRLEDGTIVPGDVIQQIDGHAVKSANDVYTQIQKHQTGDAVKLSIWRARKNIDVNVQLGQAAGDNQ